MNPRISN